MLTSSGTFLRYRKTGLISGLAIILATMWVIWESLPERRVAKYVDRISCAEFDSQLNVRIERLEDLYVANIGADGTVYALHDNFIYVSDDAGETFERRGQLPPRSTAGFLTLAKKHVARSKIVRKLRRTTNPENLAILPSGAILVFYDRIYRSSDDGWSFSAVFDNKAEHVFQPFGGNAGVAVTPSGSVFFGEYNANPRRHPIRIIRGDSDGTNWEIVHEFPAGEIRHVHSVQYDPYRNRIWILTGDHDAESHLYWSDANNWHLHELGGETQDWRIVSMIIREHDLIWGSDNDQTGASIFRWDFDAQKLEKLQDIGKVSYFSTALASGAVVINTTYEPGSPFVRNNQPSAMTDIWLSKSGDHWSKVLSFPHQEHLTAQGKSSRASVAFPAGTPGDYLFTYQYSTACEEGNTLRIKLN